jgi:hypothetical protein
MRAGFTTDRNEYHPTQNRRKKTPHGRKRITLDQARREQRNDQRRSDRLRHVRGGYEKWNDRRSCVGDQEKELAHDSSVSAVAVTVANAMSRDRRDGLPQRKQERRGNGDANAHPGKHGERSPANRVRFDSSERHRHPYWPDDESESQEGDDSSAKQRGIGAVFDRQPNDALGRLLRGEQEGNGREHPVMSRGILRDRDHSNAGQDPGQDETPCR